MIRFYHCMIRFTLQNVDFEVMSWWAKRSDSSALGDFRSACMPRNIPCIMVWITAILLIFLLISNILPRNFAICIFFLRFDPNLLKSGWRITEEHAMPNRNMRDVVKYERKSSLSFEICQRVSVGRCDSQKNWYYRANLSSSMIFDLEFRNEMNQWLPNHRDLWTIDTF